MFTGLIQDIGEVATLTEVRGGARLCVRPGRLSASCLEIGESVAVDGCCLTVVQTSDSQFTVDVSPETLSRTAIGDYRPGMRVNLERALRLGDRMGGHLVLGHIDGVGRISKTSRVGDCFEVTINAPGEVEPWLLDKGSVAVDGASLTVNEVRGDAFSVMLIPKTQQETTLCSKMVSARVNLEGDVIGKYVARLVGKYSGTRIDHEFLRENGFS